MDKRKLSIIFAIVIVALLPSAVFASVVIDQSISVTTGTSVANPLYIAEGPNYATAHGLGFTTLTQNTSSTGGSITFSYTTSYATVYLLNVLEINGIASALHGNTVSLYVASSSTGIDLYETSSAVTTSADPATFSSDLGTAITTGTTLTLTPTSATSGTEVLGYFTVELPASSTSASGTITFSYSIS